MGYAQCIIDPVERWNVLSDCRNMLLELEHRRIAYQNEHIHEIDDPSAYTPTYTSAIEMLETCMNGTPAQQIWAIMVFMFYTTGFDTYMAKQTHPAEMDRMTRYVVAPEPGELLELGHVYDIMTQMCFGMTTKLNAERDPNDIRDNNRKQRHHPFYAVCGEVNRALTCLPQFDRPH